MKKRKWWRKCNGEVKSSGGGKEAKREEKGKGGGSVTVGMY